MRLVHLTGPGQLELNYMWMPTWIGINRTALETIQEVLKAKVRDAGLAATDENLDMLNELVIETLVEKYDVVGLRDYLDGLKFVALSP